MLKVTWVSPGEESNGKRYECKYSGSGKTPLMCGVGAFLALALAVAVAHVFMMVALTKSPPPALLSWDPDSALAEALTCQAGFFFIITWISFSVGEILLLVGLSVESSHLKGWSTPRPSCLVIREGLFAAAGVFGLVAVFFDAGLYITALRAQWMLQDQENGRRETAETSVLHSSPPRSPPVPRRITAVPNGNSVVGENQNGRPLSEHLAAFNKHSGLV
ncbi:hypothetical protein U1Q18_015790 [Sarracenia purpurea var. burkii]